MLRRPPRSTLFPYTTSSDLPADLSEETFQNSPVSPRQPILSNFRVLARTNVVLRGQATKRSEEHTSELQSQSNLVCRLLLEKKNRDIQILKKAGEIATAKPD